MSSSTPQTDRSKKGSLPWLQRLRRAWGSVYLPDRFFAFWTLLLALMALGFAWSPLLWVGQAGLALLGGLCVLDGILLWGKEVRVELSRPLPRLLNLGDDNVLHIQVHNRSPRAYRMELRDELPAQFQDRSRGIALRIAARSRESAPLILRPLRRGLYRFGRTHAFLRTDLGLLERRISAETAGDVPVYPSVEQMKRFELLALPQTSRGQGLRKIRRIGHSYEFEQIKAYVPGDDRRAINWKATSRRQELMVNQYEDERSQSIYILLDCGRTMTMPFAGMSLLDYAVNAGLVLANVALQRHDKAGLLAFDRGLVAAVPAEKRRSQRSRILEALYRLKESDYEADFEGLYPAINRMSPARSLVVLFSNFESPYALERALPMLRRLARRHLLLMVLFENTEVAAAAKAPADSIPEIYRQTLASEFLYQKRQMAARAVQHGIQVVYTAPQDLSLNVVNKYLELKARGLI
jgi:uncharacterized protein (DUF58 family)